MRLTKHDVATIQQVEEYELRPGMTIQIQALPPDYDDLVEAELPVPQPERLGVEKDKRGKAVMGQDGRPVSRYKDKDPEYLKLNGENGKLRAIKLVVDGICPGELEFDAKLDPEHPKGYYKAVLLEMKEFGVSIGDLLGVANAINALSGLKEEDIEVAEEDFF